MGKKTRPEVLRLSSYQKYSTAYSACLRKSLIATMASQIRTGVPHNQHLVAGVHLVVPLNKKLSLT